MPGARAAPTTAREAASVIVNGRAADHLPADDRGLAYGDGVFRTFPVRAGHLAHWTRHYETLAGDCRRLRIPPPRAELLVRDMAILLAGAPSCAIKIIVTRGSGPRGYRPPRSSCPTRVVSRAPLPDYPPEHAREGVSVRRCALRVGAQPALAGIKHLNRLENVLARGEWDDPGVAEGLMLDVDDRVIGGTMSNVFIASGGELRTPSLTRCGVAGVTRARVLEQARAAGLVARVDDIAWADVLDADEVFVCNSLAGIWPVAAIDGERRDCGPVTRNMQRALAAEDDHAQAV